MTATHRLVRVKIVFGDDALPFSGATIHLTLEDTTLADEDSVVVRRLVREGISYDPRAGAGPVFELPCEIPDDRALYTVSVLVDLDGDGAASRGDYVNTQSYPVLTRGHPSVAAVRVKRIA